MRTVQKNSVIKWRKEGDRYLLYDRKSRNMFFLSKELFAFWDSFPAYEAFLKKCDIPPEMMQDAIEIMRKNGLLVSPDAPSQVQSSIVKGAPMPKSTLYYPIVCCLKVTNRCNYACRHCIQSSGQASKQEFSTEEIIALIEELNRNHIFALDINGGECLTRPDIRQIFSFCKQQDFDTSISTNASLIDMEMAEFLKASNVQLAKVSLEFANEQAQDALRGKGTFSQTVQGIRNLVRVGIPVTIQTAVGRYNYHSLSELVSFISSLHVNGINIFLVVPAGRADHMKKDVLAPWEYEQLLEQIHALKQQFPQVNFLNDSPLDHVYKRLHHLQDAAKENCMCLAGKTGIVIKEDGDVIPCPYFDVPLGNVRRDPKLLGDIWRGSALLNDLIDPQMLDKRCRDCSYVEECFGGCRAAAYYANGSICSVDPYCFIKEG